MQRAVAAALLHNGITRIFNFGTSDDDRASLKIIQQLGAVFSQNEDHLRILSNGLIDPQTDIISCGESGLAARLFTPIIALSKKHVCITGEGSLLKRNMHELQRILEAVGVKVSMQNGRLPANIQGSLKPDNLSIDGSTSSQYLSGLLFALSSVVTSPVNIVVENLKSKPYIDLSLKVLRHFGRKIAHYDYQKFTVFPSDKIEAKIDFTVDGDWSSAAFWLVAGALNGELLVKGLKLHSQQADEKILEILRLAKASVSFSESGIVVKTSTLFGFETDLTDAPDLFPVVSILAACAQGESRLTGVHRLLNKESNRKESIEAMLKAFGVSFATSENDFFIKGQTALKPAIINGFGDHRIVMAATVAALKVNGSMHITDVDSVSKSYPGFFADAATLGFTFQEKPSAL